MNTAESTYVINAPRMIHETIDHETVVIDTESGVYFNIGGWGYLIVQMLETGATVSELTAQLAAHFAIDATTVRPLVEDFTAQLQAVDLVVPAAATNQGGIGAPLPGSHEPFSPPVINKFTDMQDLLLIDPIHEVEDRGWPHRA